MLDRETVMQVLCGLMCHPQYLSETDKYCLTVDDFPSLFEKYIFSAIYNLYKDGAMKITVVDVDNYFNTHPDAKSLFERENGIEFLQDCLELSQEENFPFYYKRLKKFNCLRDLKKLGINTSNFYEENLVNPRAKEINDKFEELEVSDIFDTVKKKLMVTEDKYKVGDASETYLAGDSIYELLEELKITPEVGNQLQGEIFNTVCRGARKTKFYIRSADSGTGKTRAAVGDACKLAYPIRYNTMNGKWERNGSREKTLFIATEQEKEEIQTLVLAYLADVNEEKILYGSYTKEEEKRLQSAARIMKFYKDNFLIVRLSNPNISQIKAVIRQNWILHDIQNVFYDYIFSSPSLLNEFRDLRIREDVALGMLSTALKDIAVELGIFVMSSTQTNVKSDEVDGIKNEKVIRGSRAIADKCDIGCIISKVTDEELEVLDDIISQTGLIPNQVTDVFKVRRGKYDKVKIWSIMDLGTCRKQDLFITDANYREVENFQPVYFDFKEEKPKETNQILGILNNEQ